MWQAARPIAGIVIGPGASTLNSIQNALEESPVQLVMRSFSWLTVETKNWFFIVEINVRCCYVGIPDKSTLSHNRLPFLHTRPAPFSFTIHYVYHRREAPRAQFRAQRHPCAANDVLYGAL